MIVVHVSMSMVVLDWLLLADLFLAYCSSRRESINLWANWFLCLGASSSYFLLLSGGGWCTWGGLSGCRSSRGMSSD